ncbi:MAG: hypothetical protein O9264_15730 [Leptospira sp.]|nr:hypothetical protein [Leptospira sp.]
MAQKLVLTLLLFFLPTFLLAQTSKELTLGDTVPQITMTDQFGKEAVIAKEIEKILFIADMDASKLTHPLLLKEGNVYLETNKAMLISDIHRMPAIISKFVAIPKMQDYPYTIHLIKEETIGDPFPRIKGQVTMLTVKDGKLIQILFGTDEKEIRSFLESKISKPKK